MPDSAGPAKAIAAEMSHCLYRKQCILNGMGGGWVFFFFFLHLLDEEICLPLSFNQLSGHILDFNFIFILMCCIISLKP